MNYIAPAYRNHPDAEAFNAYLAEELDWSADDFDGDYAWETDIPPREAWEAEVEALNAHLATL